MSAALKESTSTCLKRIDDKAKVLTTSLSEFVEYCDDALLRLQKETESQFVLDLAVRVQHAKIEAELLNNLIKDLGGVS